MAGTEEPIKLPPFKRATMIQNGPKKRVWKSLKQILANERTLQWPANAITCKPANLSLGMHCIRMSTALALLSHTDSSVNPPPSFRPAKKYSDISGLIAPYTDPQTKLNYHNSEEFATVRSLPMDLTAGLLALRGASSIVG